MRKLVLTCLVSSTFLTSGIAQTLFTFGNNAVSKEEFLRVYQKNSMNKKADFSEKALREYMELYSLFKMKVKEAQLQQLDTLPSIEHELNNYRKQLAKNYLTDEVMSEKLIKEAYDRLKEEVRVAHILIMSSKFTAAADTLKQYQRIDSIYKAVSKGKADFAALAAKYSEDADSKNNGGDIGYFTALQTVYPFENAAYGTAVGKVSAPFRTQFGYHIVKVLDRRPAKGQVEVAQILFATQKSKGEEGLAAARKKMDSAQAELKKGVPFEDVVKKYSDDKFTINEGGLMKPFGVGDMTPAFEKAAYALKNPGDVSAPVQTDYGYHIIKLVRKIPLQSYDSMHAQLKRRIENDARAVVAKESFMNKIKQENKFKEYPANLEEVTTKLLQTPDTGKQANIFNSADYAGMTKPLYTFGGKEYSQADFVRFSETMTRGRLMGNKAGLIRDLYNVYVNNVLNDYEEHRLVEENPEFKSLMQEYKDGIMLFELMDRNVWGKASRDTTGLKAFYETKKNKYQWEPGFKGAVYTFKNEAALKEGLKIMAKKNATDEDVVKKLNSEETPDAVTIQNGRYEFSKFTTVPKAEIVKGKVSPAHKNDNGSYTVVKADEVFETSTPKSLEEAKGYIVAEYQDYLEKNWNEEMRKKYTVKIDEPVFKSMVK